MHPVMDTFPFFIYIIMCDHVVIFTFHSKSVIKNWDYSFQPKSVIRFHILLVFVLSSLRQLR